MNLSRALFGASIVVLTAYAPVAASQDTPPPPAPARTQWSWPERMRNPQVLPAETTSGQLRSTMIGFVTALDVSCQHCHVGEDGADLSTFDFASDANPRKTIARGMMRMTQQLNTRTLPEIPGLSSPSVSCYSCHRGAIVPAVSAPAS